jgi:hypothetical protein
MHFGRSGQKFNEHAVMGGIEMLDQDKRRSSRFGQTAKQPLAGVQTTG